MEPANGRDGRRRSSARSGFLTLLIVVVIAIAGSESTDVGSSFAQQPGLVLWAWERREDLRFIDPAQVSVAFLAGTVQLSGDEVAVRPRLLPVIVPRETVLFPVVRIEAGRTPTPTLSPRQQSQTLDAIGGLIQSQTAPWVQIDFDATQSQRGFYRALLTELKNRLPHGTRLSITAIASWCLGDNWLGGLPIDEVVPMLFRMGRDTDNLRHRLADGEDFGSPICRFSAGVSIDEPTPNLRAGRRMYIFAPGPWSAESYRSALTQTGARRQ
ncbi:MAG: hypothetical protein ACHQ9S_08595 [Candidatus Binatia bacterium]